MSTVTAGWPLPNLIDALARAGWADLDTAAAQGIRSVLRALGTLLPRQSATGQVTVNQIADAAGLSARWTATRLTFLEEVGLIRWTRGQLIAGRPTPGHIRVNKQALADLVRRAREQLPDRLRARAAETGRRIRETLRRSTQANRRTSPPLPPPPLPPPPARTAPPGKRTPLSERVEVSSPLPPYGEETTALRPVDGRSHGHRRAQFRAALEAKAHT